MKSPSKKDTLRLFYALWPDDATRAELARVQTQIRGRVTRYENLHITLAFLGEQPASTLPALKNVLQTLPKSPVMLALDRIGYFPKKRIAWIGTHAVPESLLLVQRSLHKELERLGAPFDNRLDFKPHITLARDAKAPQDLVIAPFVWQANHVALVESRASADGVSYSLLASRRLDEDGRTLSELGRGSLGTGTSGIDAIPLGGPNGY